MNLELINKMKQLLNERRNYRNILAEEYKTAKGIRAKEIYNEVDELVKGNKEINEAIKNVENAYNEYLSAETETQKDDATSDLLYFENKLYELAKKYGVEFEEENKVKHTEEKKSNLVRNIIVGGLAFAAGVGMTSCINQETEINQTTDETKDEDEKIESEVEKLNKIINADTELYGMSQPFTDASDEKQVMQRAHDIYETYIAIEGMPSAIKQELSIERIANFIRMANGEFALEDGQIEYNSSIFDEMGNFINAYYNSTSLVDYKNNLHFKPGCVFYENDSLAHHSAVQADELVKSIYEDIKNNNVEEFQKDSVAWGEFLRDTVIFNDFTGETISLWSMENEQKYPLIQTIISAYAPSILEYSISVDLATRNASKNQYGDTFGICIPFCYDEQNTIEYMPLSEMVYHIIETPMNDLAKRAGFEKEWAQNNESLLVQAGLTTMRYFDSKYELEIGNTKKLK